MSIVLNLQVENYSENDSFRPNYSPIISRTTRSAIFHRTYENEHIEDQFSNVAPHHRSCCRSRIHHRGRGCKGGENHAGQNDDGSFQADGSVAFEKALLPMLWVGSPAKVDSGMGAMAVYIYILKKRP